MFGVDDDLGIGLVAPGGSLRAAALALVWDSALPPASDKVMLRLEA